jgi:hypothetical protein
VLLEKRAVGRVLVDVTLLDLDPVLIQKTSGVSAGRSSGFPVEGRLGHERIVVRTQEAGEETESF